jgi:hypothetical protein
VSNRINLVLYRCLLSLLLSVGIRTHTQEISEQVADCEQVSEAQLSGNADGDLSAEAKANICKAYQRQAAQRQPPNQGEGNTACYDAQESAHRACSRRARPGGVIVEKSTETGLAGAFDQSAKLSQGLERANNEWISNCLNAAKSCINACSSTDTRSIAERCEQLGARLQKFRDGTLQAIRDRHAAERAKERIADRTSDESARDHHRYPENETSAGQSGTVVLPTLGGRADGEIRPQSNSGDPTPATQNAGSQGYDRHDHDHDHHHDHDHDHHHEERTAYRDEKKLFETMSAMTMGPAIQERGVEAVSGMKPSSAGAVTGTQAPTSAARSGANGPLQVGEAKGRAEWSQTNRRASLGSIRSAFAPAATTSGGGADFTSFNPRAPAAIGGVQGLQPTHVGRFDSSNGSARLDANHKEGDQPTYKMITLGDVDASAGHGTGGRSPGRTVNKKINLKDYLPTGSQYRNGHSPAGLDFTRRQIQPMTKDIFQLISDRFKYRCAQDRLFDCKNHLPH